VPSQMTLKQGHTICVLFKHDYRADRRRSCMDFGDTLCLSGELAPGEFLPGECGPLKDWPSLRTCMCVQLCGRHGPNPDVICKYVRVEFNVKMLVSKYSRMACLLHAVMMIKNILVDCMKCSHFTRRL
jgi:hypothetical protein